MKLNGCYTVGGRREKLARALDTKGDIEIPINILTIH